MLSGRNVLRGLSSRNVLQGLSRRRVLQGMTAVGAYTALFDHPGMSWAETVTDRRLVVILLRGGLDGINTVVPYADPAYRTARGSLTLNGPGEPDGIIDLDRYFGLHPKLASLGPFFAKGELAAVHAVGLPPSGRSHFDSQDVLENGTNRPLGTRDGWLNRALAKLGSNEPAGRRLGLSVGSSLPMILRGSAGVASWAPEFLPSLEPAFLDKVETLYMDDPLLRSMLARGIQTDAMMAKLLSDSGQTPVHRRKRKSTEIEMMVAAVGKLLASADGPRVAVFDTGGYDTHANQGTATGALARNLESLATGLTVLAETLQPVWDRTVIVTATEFGRTVVANGTGGTDHGTASASLLLGGAVNGGHIFGSWPGIESRHLYEGRDLATTTDMRSLFKGLLRDHLGLEEEILDSAVFPGSRDIPAYENLVRV